MTELEALKKIAEIHGNTGSLEGTYEYFLTIKKALVRLEAIDNANPSEAMKCLNRMLGYASLDENDFEEVSDDYDAIKQALTKAEQDKKKATCWDIVVKKNVDMLLIKKYDNVSDYNSAVWLSGRDKLSEEEFNLLKEVLE